MRQSALPFPNLQLFHQRYEYEESKYDSPYPTCKLGVVGEASRDATISVFSFVRSECLEIAVPLGLVFVSRIYLGFLLFIDGAFADGRKAGLVCVCFLVVLDDLFLFLAVFPLFLLRTQTSAAAGT